MISEFTFSRIPQIYFGPGKISVLPDIVSNSGSKILLVTGAHSLKKSGKLAEIKKILRDESLYTFIYSVKKEPSPETIDTVVEACKQINIDIVVAIGGGSVIDTGKAVSAILKVNGSVFDYLEGVGTGAVHNGRKAPFIAVPTTAGSGSEATKNAVLSRIGEKGFKKSLRHDNFVPDIAIVDPELALNCPKETTASCGMDAFSQLLEAYVSTKANPLSDALAYSGLEHIKNNLLLVSTTGAHDIQVRASMAYAALLSGITLSNAGLGIVHGLASTIGGFFSIPHGILCGTIMAEANRITVKKLFKNSQKNMKFIKKYAILGELFSGKKSKDLQTCCKIFIYTLETLTDQLQMPRLSAFGIKKSDLTKISEHASNKNNPVKLTKKEIYELLEMRL